jgi:hypothetical protein
MIYAIDSEAYCRGRIADPIVEHADEAEAMQAFRDAVRIHGGSTNIIGYPLFRSREDAQAAISDNGDEFDFDESMAFRTLDWERGFGFNF